MSKLLYQLEGVRGRTMWIFDRKCVIATKASVSSFITGNVSDGEKTIFFKDVVGVQFKKSGGLIGYLQFETSSMQMNNQGSNMFSENTFTFEHNVNGITNEQMEAIYHQVCDIIEHVKYGDITDPITGQHIDPLQQMGAPAQIPGGYQPDQFSQMGMPPQMQGGNFQPEQFRQMDAPHQMMNGEN